MEDLIKAVKSLLSDIESMQAQDDPNWFCEFEEFNDGGALTTMNIEWPNLAISAAAVRAELAKVAS